MTYYIARKKPGVWMRFAPGTSQGRGVWLLTSSKELATTFSSKDSFTYLLRDAGITDCKIEPYQPESRRRGKMDVGKLSNALADRIQQRYNEPRMPTRDELLDMITFMVWNTPDECDEEEDDECDDEDDDDDPPAPRKAKTARKP